MASTHRPWARELLRTWFHEFDSSDWYGGGAKVDALLRSRFGDLLGSLGSQPVPTFLENRETALASILLFDQIPRNIHRGSMQAFAFDAKACAITYAVIEKGWLADYSRREKQFALMPLMHSEAIADQRLSLQLFAKYAPGALAFARSHWRMVARFGRFPHRNEVLGRSTSAAEQRAIDSGFSW